jgi:hypothetical protein
MKSPVFRKNDINLRPTQTHNERTGFNSEPNHTKISDPNNQLAKKGRNFKKLKTKQRLDEVLR